MGTFKLVFLFGFFSSCFLAEDCCYRVEGRSAGLYQFLPFICSCCRIRDGRNLVRNACAVSHQDNRFPMVLHQDFGFDAELLLDVYIPFPAVPAFLLGTVYSKKHPPETTSEPFSFHSVWLP
jgi:hypothetical protein